MALLPVREAQDRMLAKLTPLGPERVTLGHANGRILAEDLAARRTQPPFDASAMDGWAVRYADVTDLPISLKVVEEIPAGAMPRVTVGAGQAARLFTGSPMPEGADTVVMQEDTTYPEDLSALTINAISGEGRHIRKKGLDFETGAVLLHKGRRLLPRHITLAASMNHAELSVTKRPRVAIISSGDELVLPGVEPGPGQIIASNGVGLATLLASWGAEPVDFGIIPDRLDALTGAIKQASEADLVITIGGASVGSHDHVIGAIEGAGGTIDFWRVAMKPGKPVIVGSVGATPLIGLPGNPVSAFVGAEIFVRTALAKLAGEPDPLPASFKVRLAAPMGATTTRQEYVRATLEQTSDGVPLAHPLARQDSSLMSALAQADVLLVRPMESPAAEAGDLVDALGLD